MTTTIYPFDPTGAALTNKIVGERQTISPPNWTDFYFILPLATPYFSESLAGNLSMVPSGKILVEGVDYICTHRFYDATVQCASPVYGSITFLDRTLSGVLNLNYQTLGGDWTLNSTQISTVLANTLLDPRITTWEEVVTLPYQFPPVSHQWDIVDMIGAKDIVSALNAMVTALLQSGSTGLATHLADFGNPHRVTAAQVGLGLVQNYAMALNADAIAGSATNLYMTPATTVQAIDQFAIIPLNAHIANVSNPHNVTATQVGLGLVQNYGLAATADAQAGILTTAYMTPALTAAAITAQAIAPLNTHLANFGNPHQVTATQVGLGNVPNYAMATSNEALAGTSTTTFMSPALVYSVLNTGLGGTLSAHIADHNNPHVVTAAQVGLGLVQNYGMAANADATAGTSTTLYMSPATTLASVTAALTPYVAHISNMANPHNVTAAQVGLGSVADYAPALAADATAGTATNLYMTPATTTTAISAQVGTAFNSHVANLSNPHQVTAAQVGAYTTAQVDSQIATLTTGKLDVTATAANSTLFSGFTVSQVVAQANQAALYIYPSVEAVNPALPTDVLYTTIATYTPPGTLNALDPLKVMELIVIGGEARADNVPPVFKVELNPRGTISARAVQYSGAADAYGFFVTQDPTTKLISLWMKTTAQHNSIRINVLSDPGGSYYSATPVTSATAPVNPIAMQITLSVGGELLPALAPGMGQVPFAQGFGATNNPSAYLSRNGSAVTTAMPIDFLNVAVTPTDITNAKALATPFSTEWRNYDRLASYGSEPMYADARTQWSWDNTNSEIVVTMNSATKVMHTALASEPIPVGQPFAFEFAVSSTDVNDQAIGACIGYFVKDGKPYGIWVMRSMGGTVIDSQNAELPGGDIYKLFTIGINLFQSDATLVAATNTGLIWGDGVLDANRVSAYVPQDVTAGTNGWAGKGAVQIRVKYDGTTMTVDTTNYGSTTYVTSATQTLTVGSLPVMAPWLLGGEYGGYRWGLAAYQQPVSKFKILGCPDYYARYIAYAPGTDGTDAGTLNYYTGDATLGTTGWTTIPLTQVGATTPGRLIFSELTNLLYFVRRDGTLTPMPILPYSGTGQPILTT